mgnify:CR=1 FL=1
MAEIIKDSLGLCQAVSPTEARTLHKFGVPTMRGVLYQQSTDDYGNQIFKKVGENTVVIGGAIQALEYLFGEKMVFSVPTLNEQFNVNNGSNIIYNERDSVIKCFGVGTGGAPLDFSTPYDEDFKQKCIKDWIPFRISDTETLDAENAYQYYFRRKIADDPTPQYGWFLKEFEKTPSLKCLWKDASEDNTDGTEITADVSDSENTNEIECFGECQIKINKNDIRPYFEWRGELPYARFNTISLVSGVKKLISTGYYDYVGARIFSVINIDNVSVKLPSELTYLYRVYTSV